MPNDISDAEAANRIEMYTPYHKHRACVALDNVDSLLDFWTDFFPYDATARVLSDIRDVLRIATGRAD